MKRDGEYWQRGRPFFVASFFVFFAAFYFYVLLRVHPELFYQQNPLVFLLDYDFFTQFTDRPGGLLDYVSAFLSPWFVSGRLGAAIVTLLTMLICLATRRFIQAVTGVGGQFVFLLPAVLILAVLGQYVHPVRVLTGLAFALWLANAYVRMAGCPAYLRLAAFVVTSAVTYYIAAGFYVFFAYLCGMSELGISRSRWLGGFCLACAIVVPIMIGVWFFGLSSDTAYTGLLPLRLPHWLATPSSSVVAYVTWTGLLLFFPLTAGVILWRRRTISATGSSETEAQPSPPTNAPQAPGNRTAPARFALAALTLLGLAVAADVTLFDSPKRCLLQIAVSEEQRRWDDVLFHVRQLPLSDPRTSDPRVACAVNRALFFRGELLDRMFEYPQALDTPSLALVYGNATTMAGLTPRQCSDILFDLGRINESEHMAHEAREIFGNRPRLLKRLVYIYILKGQPEVARPFLSFLERSLLHRRWARGVRARLDADPTLSDDPQVASRRQLMVVRDSVNDILHLETMLLGLLERNPKNRMAFEYLMAHYLLTRQLDKMVVDLDRLENFDTFDRLHLPRYCEEALLLQLATTKNRDFDLGPREIRPEASQRFRDFVQTEARYRPDVAAAFAALQPKFGDSYFFCYVFGENNAAIVQSKSSP